MTLSTPPSPASVLRAAQKVLRHPLPDCDRRTIERLLARTQTRATALSLLEAARNTLAASGADHARNCTHVALVSARTAYLDAFGDLFQAQVDALCRLCTGNPAPPA